MLGIIFGMTPICERCAVIRLLGDVFWTTRLTRSFNFVIHLHLDCRFYWRTIFKDAWRICNTKEQCQRARKAISWRQQMPQQPMLFCEVFDVWGIDFIGPFPVSFGFAYILLVIDYVLKWVEAKATKTNDARFVIDFVRSHKFCRFGIPRVFVRD